MRRQGNAPLNSSPRHRETHCTHFFPAGPAPPIRRTPPALKRAIPKSLSSRRAATGGSDRAASDGYCGSSLTSSSTYFDSSFSSARCITEQCRSLYLVIPSRNVAPRGESSGSTDADCVSVGCWSSGGPARFGPRLTALALVASAARLICERTCRVEAASLAPCARAICTIPG